MIAVAAIRTMLVLSALGLAGCGSPRPAMQTNAAAGNSGHGDLPLGTVTELAPWAQSAVSAVPRAGGLAGPASVAQRLKEQCLIESGPVGVGFCQDLADSVAREEDPTLRLPLEAGPLPGDILIRGPWRRMVAIRQGPMGTRVVAVAGDPADRILIGTVPRF